MDKTDYGLYISVLGLIVIVVWAILKSFNIIHSPTYQEMIPIFGAAVTFGGMIATINNLMTANKEIKTDVYALRIELKSEIKEVRDKVFHMDKDIEIIKDRQVR